MDHLRKLCLYLLFLGLFWGSVIPVAAQARTEPQEAEQAPLLANAGDDQTPTSIALKQAQQQAAQTEFPLWLTLFLLLSIATLVAFQSQAEAAAQPIFSLSRVRWRLVALRWRLRQGWEQGSGSV